MNNNDQDPGEDDEWGDGATGDFAVDSIDPDAGAAPQEKPDGPPEKYRDGSWYDRSRQDWWWNSRLDPCPVRPYGHGPGGIYYLVTPQGELRKFTAAQLHRAGGLADLFAARLWWLIKHFPGVDKKTGEPTKRPNAVIAAEAMMRACVDVGYVSGDVEHRMAGTWRGPDGRPIVHAGNALIREGEILKPGARLGTPLYVIAGKRERPAMVSLPRGGSAYADVPAQLGQNLVAALFNWNFQQEGAAELVAGYLAQAFLGDATHWRSHMFLRAQPGSGKSTLMLLMRAALGGAGQDIANTYSGAFVEQEFLRQACGILLDENESDGDQQRMKKLRELIRLLSDQGGAKGGRGGADGTARKLDVRGAVCMAATAVGHMKQQDRERITIIQLLRFEEEGRERATQEEIEALILRVAEWSAQLRARVLGRWDLFCENLRLARTRIHDLGGTARDGNQLGHLLAGWWTLTQDHPADADMLDDIGKRFLPWIISLSDAEEGTDPASQCWNKLLGSDAHVWRGGESLTVGQVIARAREPGGGESHRRALLGMGLRLLPADLKDKNPLWFLADLGIANTHDGLMRIFEGSDWSDGRWADVLCHLEFRPIGGDKVKVSLHGPVRFGGPQSRGVLVPSLFLPSMADEEP
jgi:hypothetical protein